MTARGRVVVVGSLNLDHVVRTARFPHAGETLTAHGLTRVAGGKGGNQAAAAARAGARVRLVGVVGADPSGNALLDALLQQDVDVTGVRRDPDVATGCAVVTVADTGENSILVAAGANATLAPDQLGPHLAGLDADDVVLTQLETPDEVVTSLASRAGPWRLVVNASPLPDDDDRVHQLWREALVRADVVIVNSVEAARLLAALGIDRVAGPAERAGMLVDHGLRSAVVTAGADGAWWAAPGRTDHVAAWPVTVVDTTGAGDAFAGAVAAGLATGRSADAVLIVAARAGADATTWPGAQPRRFLRPP